MSLRALRRVVAPLLVTALCTFGAGTAVTLVTTGTAFADSSVSMESQFIAKMNGAREANGLRPYAVASDLTSIARQHSAEMASRQELYHNPSLTTQVQNWQAVGENVGEGPTVDDIHTAFMNSPEHRANILDHDFTEVGVGVTVDKNGVIWVTEDFRQPMHSSAPSSSSSSAPSGSRSSTGHSTHATAAPVAAPVAAPSPWHGAQTLGRTRPAPHPSARIQLLHRLRQLRHTPWVHRAQDPVAQSFTYFTALSRLAG